jgi:hypothetical protein
VTGTWHNDITSQAATWPHNFPLGAAAKPDLENNFGSFQQQVFRWRDWADDKGLDLTFASRHVCGTVQSIPTHLTVPDLDTAVSLLDIRWKHRIQRGRAQAKQLAARFPQVADLGKILRAVDGYSDTDFDLLCSSAEWFMHNTASGLTPRQVPIEGLHAKWLDSHQPLLQILAGTDNLGLLPRHPQRLHFTYLDPEHRAAGGRTHDSATVGDPMAPAYRPEMVIISENKDTAIHFPPLRNAISVEGAGFGGAGACASFGWITTCPHLIYWGDMDASGLEIVDLFRRSGVPVSTILMDLDAFHTYERFGSSTDARGNPLAVSARKNLGWLTGPERALYKQLTDPDWARVRRVEQERIPLMVALAAVTADMAMPCDPFEPSGSSACRATYTDELTVSPAWLMARGNGMSADF